MGRKMVSTRVRQRKKPFRKKSGGQKSIHQRGRRWCIQCGRSHGVEHRLRRAVHDSLAPLRGRQAKCPKDCECVMCVGDLNGIARFGERRLDQW